MPEAVDVLTSLPYSLEPSGRVIVDVSLNGNGPFRFAVDTAATSSFITVPALAQLEIATVPDLTATVHGALASGRFPVAIISQIGVGTERWRDARLVVLPAATRAVVSIDGALGADFLNRYSVAFAIAERQLRIYDAAAMAAADRGWAPIALTERLVGDSAEPLYFLDAEIAGHRIPALLDLGTGISVLNVAAAKTLQLGATRSDKRGEFAGAVGSQPVLAQLGRQRLRTGGLSWRNEVFLIADLEIFTTLDMVEHPAAVIGSGLLTQRDFILDLPRNRLLVRRSMAETDAAGSPQLAGIGLR